MDYVEEPIAGPSRSPSASPPPPRVRAVKPIRKPRAPHPDQSRPARISRPPPLPAPPAHPSRPGGTTTTHPHLPIKVLQGAGTRRTDSTKKGFGKEVIFVTRKTSLGALMGRCRSLVVDEGYTHLVLHSLGAAIPHSLLLLHAVLDTLPYPRGPRGLWYEIRTGTEECVDHIEAEDPARPIAKLPKTGGKGKGKEVVENTTEDTGKDTAATAGMGDRVQSVGKEGAAEKGDDGGAAVKSWLAGIGGVEATEPLRNVRLTSSMKIDIYIGPKPSLEPSAVSAQARQSKTGEGRSRPNKKRRQALAKQRQEDQEQEKAGGEEEEEAKHVVDQTIDEEVMFNGAASEEEQEEVEMR